jgi:hypothetical protein
MYYMNTFTKWFLVNAVMLTAVFLAEQKGAVSTVIKNDISHISILIMILYVTLSAYVGKLSYLADRASGNNVDDIDAREGLSRRSEVGWFAAEHFFSLGLLGTVFGLCVATATNLNAEAQVTDIVAGLKVGLNTAFYTTICGITCSLPLQVQLMILRFKLEE